VVVAARFLRHQELDDARLAVGDGGERPLVLLAAVPGGEQAELDLADQLPGAVFVLVGGFAVFLVGLDVLLLLKGNAGGGRGLRQREGRGRPGWTEAGVKGKGEGAIRVLASGEPEEGTMRLGWLAALAALVLMGTAAEAAPLKIYTQWKGAALPLDVVNGGELDNFVHLAPAGNFSGQQWTMTPDEKGTFRLTTAFRGKDMCLDVVRVKNGGGLDGFLKLTRVFCALSDRA
jgi:hypothetical protein